MNRPKSQEEDNIGQTQLMVLRCAGLMTAMPTIGASMASAREIRYKVPPGFIIKVGQRPRAVPGSLQGPPGDPPRPCRFDGT